MGQRPKYTWRKNMDTSVKIKKLRQDAVIPVYKTAGAAAADLCYAGDSPLVIKAGKTEKVPTGLAISIESADVVALIYARSGISTKFGIAPANCVGVIDSDYRGEITVPLHNHSENDFTVEAGDRIAQIMFAPVYRAVFEETLVLDETERGEGGFGSTGIN